jgi:hypothetical protein
VRPIAVHLPELHSFISTYGSSSIADKHMNVKEEEEEQEYPRWTRTVGRITTSQPVMMTFL